jgi:hypothetical protein
MVWLHGKWSGSMSRRLHLPLRLIVTLLVLAAAGYGSMRAYVEYEAYRAKSMLAEASRVQVGDSESSVLPLVKRYGGFKWAARQLSPIEDWIDKDEYDYQKNRLSDYEYELGISSFGNVALAASRLTRTMRAVREGIPVRFRSVLGLRDWGTVVELSIRNNRVQSVSAMTLFQGRSGWLGHKWEVSEGMPRHDMRQQTFAVGAAFLTMGDGGGMMIENFFTPKASDEEIEAARKFNAGCLTSVRGCNGLCDVAPRALEYLEQKPDAAWNITPTKCH